MSRLACGLITLFLAACFSQLLSTEASQAKEDYIHCVEQTSSIYQCFPSLPKFALLQQLPSLLQAHLAKITILVGSIVIYYALKLKKSKKPPLRYAAETKTVTDAQVQKLYQNPKFQDWLEGKYQKKKQNPETEYIAQEIESKQKEIFD